MYKIRCSADFHIKVLKQQGIFTQLLSRQEVEEIDCFVKNSALGIYLGNDEWKLRDSQSFTTFCLKYNVCQL
jgi:hypothetical protein